MAVTREYPVRIVSILSGEKPVKEANCYSFCHCNPDFLHIWDVIDGVHLLDVFGF